MPKRKTNDEFLKELQDINSKYIPLQEYKNNHIKMPFKCSVHNIIFYSTAKQIFHSKENCPKCIGQHRRKLYLKTNAEFLQELKDKNIDVLPLEDYNGGDVKILFKCSCGENWYTTPNRVLLGNHCKKCGYSRMAGEKNYFYNPNLTSEDRELSQYRYRNPQYREFRDSCFARDNYTCRITGKVSTGDIVVHHLNGFNWDIKNRANTDNGITLNKIIHKEFHRLYGKGNNTKEQFLEFIEKLYSEDRILKERYISLKNQINKIK